MKESEITVAVIGLGYVGLPLALAFGSKYNTIGFDVNTVRIDELKKNIDRTGEADKEHFEAASKIVFTNDEKDLKEADFIIVAVPTPIDNARQPDLTPVRKASECAGRNLKKGAILVFESTVYPGVTEEVCVPILEKESGLFWKTDFHVGYSPERINPGDKEHTIRKTIKVVSGDDADTLEKVSDLYASIIGAGVYKAASIKEAEAAKVIENTQRDLNIALINELAIIFDKLGIDTLNVLEAAGSKWNFLPFRPGLVGGHCIGVDPYYLTYKAEMEGYHPEVILAGRRINDNMGQFIAQKTVKMMIHAGHNIKGSRVGILGLTFKEDCPDLRNSRVIDIINELKTYSVDVLVHDPMADKDEAKKYYGINLTSWEEMANLDAVILAVGHKFYRNIPTTDLADKIIHRGCLVDVKSILNVEEVKKTGLSYWRL